jgi:PIN domain nuclease of toxin-antitoxin system
MTILLDSHAFYWWMTGDPRLSLRAANAIRGEARVYVSAVTAWEIANKVRIGKWPQAQRLAQRIVDELAAEQFTPLPIALEHAQLAGLLPGVHRDPFDRMLAAQSRLENAPLVTADPVFKAFGTDVLW